MTTAAPPAEDAAPRRVPRVGKLRARGVDWVAVAAMAMLAVFLQPALHAALRADDTWVSEERGIVELSGGGLLRHLWGTAENFVASGRPNVLGTTEGLLGAWFVGGDRVATHAMLIALTVAAAGVLYALVRELGLSRDAALLTVGLLAGAIQFRSYHDPMLGYFGSIQIVLILTLGSLLVFVRGLRAGNRRMLIWSFLLFLPCPLIYEGSYTLVGVHLGVALCELRGRAALKAAAPFLALGAGFILLSLYTRANATVTVQGYEVGSSPLAALRTYVLQLFTPIPASNLIFRADYGSFLALGGQPTKAELLAGGWRGAAVFALVLLLSLRMAASGRLRLPSGRTLRDLAVVGGLLWLTSVALVSAAPKYQMELVAGKGHLPALVQVFGWALVAVAALCAVLKAASRRSLWAVRLTAFSAAGLFGLAAAFVGYNNMRVVALETPIAQSRDLLETATAEGTFAPLPRDASLIFSRRDLGWPTGSWAQVPDAAEAMFLNRGDKRLDVRIVPPPDRFDCPRSGTFPPQDCEVLAPTAAWVSLRDYRAGGSVVIARLAPGTSETAASATTRELRAFAHREDGTVRPPQLVGRTAKDTTWKSGRQPWRRVAGEGDWAIYEVRLTGSAPVASSLDDVDARMNFAAMPPPGQMVRLYGTKRLLP